MSANSHGFIRSGGKKGPTFCGVTELRLAATTWWTYELWALLLCVSIHDYGKCPTTLIGKMMFDQCIVPTALDGNTSGSFAPLLCSSPYTCYRNANVRVPASLSVSGHTSAPAIIASPLFMSTVNDSVLESLAPISDAAHMYVRTWNSSGAPSRYLSLTIRRLNFFLLREQLKVRTTA